MMEPYILHKAEQRGWIELICGSMFSGKTEELIRRLRRAQIARQRVEIFKPAIETRYSRNEVVSHDATAIHSTAVQTAQEILINVGDAATIGIDEAQFFDLELVRVVDKLARAGKRVIIAGLDQDYLGRPFEPVPSLMAIAEHVTKLHAICVVCGAPANHSQRISEGDERVMLGALEAYEPRCRHCFEPHAIPKSAQTEMDLGEGTAGGARER